MTNPGPGIGSGVSSAGTPLPAMPDLATPEIRSRDLRPPDSRGGPLVSDVPVSRVLIADDQGDVLDALRLLLKSEGYRLESANSPAAILDALDSRDFDVVLMDLNYARDTTSGQEGLDLLT